MYTSYEKDGSVNRYEDQGDGHHNHKHWDSKYDYNLGEEPDWKRLESGKSDNPTIEEVQENGGCYLTSACIQHFSEEFDDKCYELSVLRWFRDYYVSAEDREHYYETSPIIVSAINQSPDKDLVYNYIYDYVVDKCINLLEEEEYFEVYDLYKKSILVLEEKFARPLLMNKLIKTLKK